MSHASHEEASNYFDAATPDPAPNATLALSRSIEPQAIVASEALLPAPARKAMLELLVRGQVLQRSRAQTFAELMAHQDAIARVLGEMELQMVVDAIRGLVVLMTIPDIEDSSDGPSLIRRRTLTLYESLIVLVLRKHYREREDAGETRVVLEIDGLANMLTPFLPLAGAESIERKHLLGSIERFKSDMILLAVRGDDAQVEISPAIRILVDRDVLQTLYDQYLAMAQAADAPKFAKND